MNRREMEDRMMKFALRAAKLCDALPRSTAGRVVANQLLRCATSVACNYRAAGRARSRREFAAKLGIAEEEADECAFWFEFASRAGFVRPARVSALNQEALELTAIIVASRKKARTT